MRFKKSDPSTLNYVRKVRLLPTSEQADILDGQSRICNWLQNKLKDEVDERLAQLALLKADAASAQEVAKPLLDTVYSVIGLRNLVPALKEAHPFLERVHSSPLKNIALRVADTIARFQKQKKLHGGVSPSHSRWLSYSSWKKAWTSLEYEEPHKGWGVAQFGWLELALGTGPAGGRLRLRLKLERPPKRVTHARSCRIIREGRDRYYAVFSFKRRKPKLENAVRAVYMDPNHTNFVYGLDTAGRAFEVANLPGLKQAERALDQLLAKRDRCTRKSLWVDTVRSDSSVGTHYRPSRRWSHYNDAVERLQLRVREQKKHAMFSLANLLCREYDLIGIGNYVPVNADHGRGGAYNRAMVNRPFHGRFKSILAWVASRSGKRAVVVPESGTTRTCHRCGHVAEGGIAPGIAAWTCQHCATQHLRDENACQNGLVRMLTTSSVEAPDCLPLPCSGPMQVTARCDWHFHPQGWREAPQGSANVNSMRTLNRQGQLRSHQGVIASSRIRMNR